MVGADKDPQPDLDCLSCDGTTAAKHGGAPKSTAWVLIALAIIAIILVIYFVHKNAKKDNLNMNKFVDRPIGGGAGYARMLITNANEPG